MKKNNSVSAFALAALHLYQATEHIKRQLLITVFGYQSVCKHRPTCSQYAMSEIRKSGTITGLLKSFWRVLRCF